MYTYVIGCSSTQDVSSTTRFKITKQKSEQDIILPEWIGDPELRKGKIKWQKPITMIHNDNEMWKEINISYSCFSKFKDRHKIPLFLYRNLCQDDERIIQSDADSTQKM